MQRNRWHWCGLHLSTWIAITVTLAALTLIIVPAPWQGPIGLGQSLHYEHGWPFVCMDRFVSPWGPWDVDDRNKFLQSEGVRRAREGDLYWIDPKNWPISGRCFVRWNGLVLDLVVAITIIGSISLATEWSWLRRWRYTTRHLFMLIFLLSVIMAWWIFGTRRCAREERLIEALERSGFVSDQSTFAPIWLCRLVGWNQLPWRVIGIEGPREVSNSTYNQTSSAFAVANGFSNLERVDLWVADDRTMRLLALLETDLEKVHGSSGLRELRITGQGVTDSGLQHLTGCSKLRELRLVNTLVTDEGVKKLQAALPTCKIIR